MPTIDAGRTIADLRRLATFGAYKTGVHRPTYSPQDVAARHWIAERMREAGLSAVIDGIGNVIGRSAADGPRLLIGSHSESQNMPAGSTALSAWSTGSRWRAPCRRMQRPEPAASTS
jgi:beta-ureidopropionase / N-carbamoyl-L-amino-acid hydrolase